MHHLLWWCSEKILLGWKTLVKKVWLSCGPSLLCVGCLAHPGQAGLPLWLPVSFWRAASFPLSRNGTLSTACILFQCTGCRETVEKYHWCSRGTEMQWEEGGCWCSYDQMSIALNSFSCCCCSFSYVLPQLPAAVLFQPTKNIKLDFCSEKRGLAIICADINFKPLQLLNHKLHLCHSSTSARLTVFIVFLCHNVSQKPYRRLSKDLNVHKTCLRDL